MRRRRSAPAPDYDRLAVAAAGADIARLVATAVAARARALVVAVPRVEQAVDVLYEARDAGFEGQIGADYNVNQNLPGNGSSNED